MMKTLRIRMAATLWMAVVALAVVAQGPNNTGKYYQDADGKKAAALKTALHDIIGNPNVVSYSGLREAYTKTDVRPDGYLRDWYSNITNYEPGSSFGSYSKEGDAYNREHSMPQSWYNEASPMKSDVMQVLPTDGYINNMRSDNPFGEVNTQAGNYKHSANNYSKSGSSRTEGYAGTVFEPNDEVKGDIARIYFYMATCYEDRILTWTNGKASNVIGGTTYEPLKAWVMNMMMRWAALDPVDSIERARNAAVYGVQRNRNPYVDYPGLEQYVWGSKKDVAFSYDRYEGAEPGPYNPGGTDPDPDEPDTPDTPDTPAEGSTITLNNAFFGVDWTGVRPEGSNRVISGTQGGVTVTYSMGDGGSNMYANDSHIRLYKKNTLAVAVKNDAITDVDFTVIDNTSNHKLTPDSGAMTYDTRWNGSANSVTFTVDDGSGHIKLSAITVALASASGIDQLISLDEKPVIYNLQGIRVAQPSHGLYVVNGKKVMF